MERFKIVERETKTKAYSKEVLMWMEVDKLFVDGGLYCEL